MVGRKSFDQLNIYMQNNKTGPRDLDSVFAACAQNSGSESYVGMIDYDELMNELEQEFPHDQDHTEREIEEFESFLQSEDGKKYREEQNERFANEALLTYDANNKYQMDANKEIKKFFKTHFAKTDCTSCANGAGYFVMAQNGSIIVRSAKGHDFLNQVSNLSYYKTQNYYITANSFRSPQMRNMVQLFGLHNIVIDCDCHSTQKNPDQMKDDAKRAINDILAQWTTETQAVPKPNSVVFTGRGIQLWWSFMPVKPEYSDCYDFLAKYIGEIVDRTLGGHQFEVDWGASSNKAGCFRMPGTINNKTGAFAEVHVLDSQINDMFEIKKRAFRESNKNKPENVVMKRTPATSGGYVQDASFASYAEHRVVALNILLVKRDFNLPHMRDYFLWLFHNDARKYLGDEIAYKITVVTARMLKNPISEKEVTHIIQGTLNAGNQYCKNGGYAVRNSTIIQLLGISVEEQNIINLHPAKGYTESCPNKTRDAAAYERRMMKYARYVSALKYAETMVDGQHPKNKDICKKYSISNTTLVQCRKNRAKYMEWASTEEGKESIRKFQHAESKETDRKIREKINEDKERLEAALTEYNAVHKTRLIVPHCFLIDTSASAASTEYEAWFNTRGDPSKKKRHEPGWNEERRQLELTDRSLFMYGVRECASGNASISRFQ